MNARHNQEQSSLTSTILNVGAVSGAVSPTGLYQTAAMLNPLNSVAGSNVITPSFGSSAWDQAVGQKVVWMVGASEQSATLTLNPPDLGPVQVVINVNNEKADTTFISENPEVRKALEDGIPVLRDMMNQAGITLGQANINTNQQHQQQTFQQSNRSSSQFPVGGSEASVIDTGTSSRVVARVANGLVDTFA